MRSLRIFQITIATIGRVSLALALLAGTATAQDRIWSTPKATAPMKFGGDFCNWCGCCTETQQSMKMREFRKRVLPDYPGEDVVIMHKSYADLIQQLMDESNDTALSNSLKQMRTQEIGARVDFCNWCKCCIETDEGLDIKIPEMVDPEGMKRFIIVPK